MSALLKNRTVIAVDNDLELILGDIEVVCAVLKACIGSDCADIPDFYLVAPFKGMHIANIVNRADSEVDSVFIHIKASVDIIPLVNLPQLVEIRQKGGRGGSTKMYLTGIVGGDIGSNEYLLNLETAID